MPTATQTVPSAPTSFATTVSELRERLSKQAFLYESPQDFRAGVDAALRAIERETSDDDLFAVLDEIDLSVGSD